MRILLYMSLLLMLSTCAKTPGKSQNEQPENIKTVSVPDFNADSAFLYIKKQVDFGPRVPNTHQHVACANYLKQKLTDFGAQLTVQEADLKAFDGTILKASNIIGSYNPEAATRILLFAHWDTRPWSDHDPDSKNHSTPVSGANDGASGVGVLLEMARHFGKEKPDVGVDIIFFDAEDYGAPADKMSPENENSWCLGSQYWASNKHIPGYRAKYGILLDMVGAPQARFYREQISEYYASYVVDLVWKKAASLGYAHYFINQPGGSITDDHLYINQKAGIPSIDIIHYDPNTATGFGHYWHTVNDTMENIDKNTLSAVGKTLMQVVYNEQP